MSRYKYYVRVSKENIKRFHYFLDHNNIEYSIIDMNTTIASLYVVYMTDDEEIILKLTVPLIGSINFDKAQGRVVTFGKI